MRTKTDHQKRVEEFMQKATQNVPNIPTLPDTSILISRMKQLWEELLETTRACGLVVRLNPIYLDKVMDDVGSDFGKWGASENMSNFATSVANSINIDHKSTIDIQPDNKPDLVEIVDGLADISVVNTGTFSALGVADDLILETVDQNNLNKFGPGSYLDSSGKWRKPPGHKKPDFLECLRQQGYVEPVK